MREIKFRGQQIGTKEWRYGFLSKRSDYHTIREQEIKDCAYHTYDVISKTVGQFTGLKDKNGVDIYEGDLISFGDVHWEDDGMPDIKEIVFDEDTASFRIYDYLELQGSSLAEKWYIDDVIDIIEVIGNINSNPELLEYLK